jgi:ribosomal protein S19
MNEITNKENQQQLVIVNNELLNDLLQEIKELKSELQELKGKSSVNNLNLLTRKETSEFFKVTEKTIDLWARSKIIIPHKVGKLIYYRYDELKYVIDRKGINSK